MQISTAETCFAWININFQEKMFKNPICIFFQKCMHAFMHVSITSLAVSATFLTDQTIKTKKKHVKNMIF